MKEKRVIIMEHAEVNLLIKYKISRFQGRLFKRMGKFWKMYSYNYIVKVYVAK